ncbi:MAG: restriction endonuclease [Candidatus Devosia phytovorans]|uniref:Restriction endonuclease n=1 Tax=Candidatus Devosia phytovorans TaxID=3121372 RepID=A0AAJ5VTU6_9HYPH|nr:restriction endonuclease [Devosia sp.]WEK04242.1 MAG: restriction endonuclease [Devosia sp.]
MRPSARRIEAAIAAIESAAARRAPDICPLCERIIPPEAKSSRHHLTPRLKGGTHLGTVRLHQICHSAIHARFSETEIAAQLADVASLKSDPELAAFIQWVRGKPPAFHAPTRLTRQRREMRRSRE